MNSPNINQCLHTYIGELEYQEAYKMQQVVHRKVSSGLVSNSLILLEHPHVFTLGRRGQDTDVLASKSKLASLGVSIHYSDRGGQATYHGPGQLVGYPIINLKQAGLGPLKYVRALENIINSTLSIFGIKSSSSDRPTGVWVGEKKIAAIGIRVSRGVTMHGFALNVNPDQSYFDHIVPCGLPEAKVTTMENEMPTSVTVSEVLPILVEQFGINFGWAMKKTGNLI